MSARARVSEAPRCLQTGTNPLSLASRAPSSGLTCGQSRPGKKGTTWLACSPLGIPYPPNLEIASPLVTAASGSTVPPGCCPPPSISSPRVLSCPGQLAPPRVWEDQKSKTVQIPKILSTACTDGGNVPDTPFWHPKSLIELHPLPRGDTKALCPHSCLVQYILTSLAHTVSHQPLLSTLFLTPTEPC